ncbi:MAG: hypothetical protein ACLVHE_04580 [Dialister invisus]
MVIGRGGTGIEDIKKALATVTDKRSSILILSLKLNPKHMSAILVGAEDIASQLKDASVSAVLLQAGVGRTMRTGLSGIKVTVSGRLGRCWLKSPVVKSYRGRFYSAADTACEYRPAR